MSRARPRVRRPRARHFEASFPANDDTAVRNNRRVIIRGSRWTVIGCYSFYAVLLLLGGYWPLELGTHFYPQYSLLALLTGIYFFRRDEKWSGTFLVVLSLLLLAPYHHTVTADYDSHSKGSKKLRIAFLNTSQSSNAARQFSVHSSHNNRALIFFAGVSPEGVQSIQNVLGESHPHRHFRLADGVFGIGVASKYPVRNFRYAHKGIPESPFGGKNPWVKGEVKFNDEWLEFWVVHPPRPIRSQLFRIRNSLLTFLADPGNEEYFPDFVIGDFNVTPTSPYYRSIRQTAYWTSGTRGNPFAFTWPASFPPLWIAIDHAFTGPRLDSSRFRVGPSFGSNHYSIAGTVTTVSR